jgi:hypothetical protein
VPDLFSFLTHSGQLPAILALALVLFYFVFAVLALTLFEPKTVLVTRYEPSKGASPAVAAWLFDHGELPRALAAALVHMAVKGYVRIEQNGDLYTITQLGPDVSLDLSPEEDAIARGLFKGYDCFDFDGPTSQLQDALEGLTDALMNTGYFSRRILFSLPAWALSGFGVLFALVQGNFRQHVGMLSLMLLTLGFGCFVVAVRTVPGTLQKIGSRLPGAIAPKRPWSGSDSMNVTLLLVSTGAIAFLALLSATTTALLVAAFLAVNAFFFHALQGPTTAGRKMIAQLTEYRNFLAEVHADEISRMTSCDTPPAEMTQKQAYAIAFHLDLGWGQQFVDTVTDLVERSEVFSKILRPQTQGS